MNIEKTINEMTFPEKARLLAGCGMVTCRIDRLGISDVRFADGPHGVRCEREKNRTHFPSLCLLGSTFSKATARRMGEALADECIEEGIDCLLGPGINIKRHILCGRNFEYLSEDPVISGELSAEYINGLQSKGVSACLKHYAANNQEENRLDVSAEIDERVLREIYLRGFEIANEKSSPESIMCSYNKINGVWASENMHLLHDILKNEWGYSGVMLSDWGAVQDISRAVHAGLDLQMPANSKIVDELTSGVENGTVTMDEINDAVRRVLTFVSRERPKGCNYDRDRQHRIAREIAADGIVLLKNDDRTLPITAEKYKKIAVVGEYAVHPLIAGQGSAEVLQSEDYTDSPIEELKAKLPGVEFKYVEMYKTDSYSHKMLWPESAGFKREIEDCDLVVFFAGSMVSEDTENFDRRSALINQNFEMFMKNAQQMGKRCVSVLQNGGALIFGKWLKSSDAILECWLGGEAAGGAAADVLTGDVNPSGKLAETFPKSMRTDLEYPGGDYVIEYRERFDVGYRYYDKHPEEILYPFGHGLSYTEFEYNDLEIDADNLRISFMLKNVGECDGAEAWQLYIGDPNSTVVRSVKELRAFDKVFLKAGEERCIDVALTVRDLSYFNTSLGEWVAECGRYDVYVGTSSRDIRLLKSFIYDSKMPYSMKAMTEPMIG